MAFHFQKMHVHVTMYNYTWGCPVELIYVAKQNLGLLEHFPEKLDGLSFVCYFYRQNEKYMYMYAYISEII